MTMNNARFKPLDEKDTETMYAVSAAAQNLFDISQTCLVENSAHQADWASVEAIARNLRSQLRKHRQLDNQAAIRRK